MVHPVPIALRTQRRLDLGTPAVYAGCLCATWRARRPATVCRVTPRRSEQPRRRPAVSVGPRHRHHQRGRTSPRSESGASAQQTRRGECAGPRSRGFCISVREARTTDACPGSPAGRKRRRRCSFDRFRLVLSESAAASEPCPVHLRPCYLHSCGVEGAGEVSCVEAAYPRAAPTRRAGLQEPAFEPGTLGDGEFACGLRLPFRSGRRRRGAACPYVSSSCRSRSGGTSPRFTNPRSSGSRFPPGAVDAVADRFDHHRTE